MSEEQFKVLEQRVDGVARVVLALIADLEVRECIDGERFCKSLRAAAEGRASVAGCEVSGAVMRQVCDQLDAARA